MSDLLPLRRAPLIIATGLLLALGVLREWNLDGYPRRAVFALMLTGANWLVGALTTSSPNVGHTGGSSVTELGFRKQIRPVIHGLFPRREA